jgi:hypothetical protein
MVPSSIKKQNKISPIWKEDGFRVIIA